VTDKLSNWLVFTTFYLTSICPCRVAALFKQPRWFTVISDGKDHAGQNSTTWTGKRLRMWAS